MKIARDTVSFSHTPSLDSLEGMVSLAEMSINSTDPLNSKHIKRAKRILYMLNRSAKMIYMDYEVGLSGIYSKVAVDKDGQVAYREKVEEGLALGYSCGFMASHKAGVAIGDNGATSEERELLSRSKSKYVGQTVLCHVVKLIPSSDSHSGVDYLAVAPVDTSSIVTKLDSWQQLDLAEMADFHRIRASLDDERKEIFEFIINEINDEALEPMVKLAKVDAYLQGIPGVTNNVALMRALFNYLERQCYEELTNSEYRIRNMQNVYKEADSGISMIEITNKQKNVFAPYGIDLADGVEGLLDGYEHTTAFDRPKLMVYGSLEYVGSNFSLDVIIPASEISPASIQRLK